MILVLLYYFLLGGSNKIDKKLLFGSKEFSPSDLRLVLESASTYQAIEFF